MEVLKINEAKIILDDKGEGTGELIIASSWGYNFSTYWGSMGRPLKEFICSIDKYYFANRLSGPDDRPVFNAKQTVKSLRKAWKGVMPWYEEMEFQKQVREFFKELERCDTQYEFVESMGRMEDRLEFYDIEQYRRSYVRQQVSDFCEEPWHYIETGPSHKTIWLQRLHGDLVKVLKLQSVPQLT